MNYETIYETAWNRSSKDKPKAGTIKPEAEIRIEPLDTEFYLSMFGFDNSIYEWMEFQKTVSGFNGHYFCKYLYFDVDRTDLTAAHEEAKELVRNLYANLSVNPKHLFICFSGSKGFHIGLHQNLFGGFGYAKDLPIKLRALACIVAGMAYNQSLQEVDREYTTSNPKSFRGLDLGIYNANRIFRVINSRNAKSGLYKIGLTSNELFNLSTLEIKDLAASARTDYRLEHKVSELQKVDELADAWRQASVFDANAYMQANPKSDLPTEAFFRPPSEGDRNNSLFKQAAMLFDHSDLSKESVRQLVQCINLASPKPLPEKEVETIVRSAYSRTNMHEKPFEAAKKPIHDVETFSHWVDDWVDYQTSDRKPLTFLLPELDSESEMDYRGKLICLIGGAGSMKSYFAQNVMRENVLGYNARCAYASMEMSKVQNVNRFMDLIFAGSERAASEELREMVRKDKKLFYDTVSSHVTALSGKLMLSNKGRVNTKYLRNWIKMITETHGPVDILTVDGASMMEGASDDEIKAMVRHSEELKEFANESNICVQVIFHVTKGIQPHDRNVVRAARGSGKIIDNGDMFLGFSKLIDPVRSSPENLKYMFGYGHINYWNKRGRGQTLDLLFQADPISSIISPTIRIPEEFPTFEEFSREYNRKNKRKDDSVTEF